MDRGQLDQVGRLDVVVSDHRQLTAHIDPKLARGLQHTEGESVVRGNDSCGWVARGQDGPGRPSCFLTRVFDRADERRLDLDTASFESLRRAAETHRARAHTERRMRRVADERNAGVAEIEEVLCLSLIHISEPTRLGMISYAVFCLKK